MPVFLGPLVGLSLGALLAWLSAAGRDPRGPGGRGLLVVSLFGALLFGPLVAFFLAVAGDWSYAYLVDGRRVPSAVELVLVLAAAASVPAGYALTRSRLPARSQGRALAPLFLPALPGALALALAFALRDRLGVDATYAEFRGRFGADPVAGGRLGYALLWTHACLAAGLWITARALRAEPPAEADGEPRVLGRARRGAQESPSAPDGALLGNGRADEVPPAFPVEQEKEKEGNEEPPERRQERSGQHLGRGGKAR